MIFICMTKYNYYGRLYDIIRWIKSTWWLFSGLEVLG
jgi:hypothetical protein